VDTMDQIAARVRQRRKQLGLTQIDLALIASVSPTFIYQVEKAKPTVSLEPLVQVLSALGLAIKVVP